MPLNSQITLKPNQVKSFVNENGDTLIAMRLDDAKVILADVLNYQVSDSLVKVYESKDKENANIILIQKNVIVKLTEKSENQEKQLKIFEEIIGNKDTEISLLNDVIKQQKREIRKQKLLKIGGFSAAIILPVVTALILLN